MPMPKIFAAVLILQFFAITLTLNAQAANKRVALVIGNSAYTHAAPLKNPENDAREIEKKLKTLGFDVVMGINLKHRQFARVIGKFKQKLALSDVALFFYAGHGLQLKGRNYLMPVDAQLDDETSLDFEAVQLNTILRLMERRQRINIVFLDACRNNPIARNLARSMGTRSVSVGRGLAPVESGVGTLIAYATQPGNVALDGNSTNSPFTRSLIKHISTPALDIALMMRRVRQDVIGETGGQQIPWQHSSLTTPFVFNEQAPAPVAVQAPVQVPQISARPSSTFSSSDIEIACWQSATTQGTKEAYQAYINKFPNGNFASLAKIKLNQFRRIAALNTQTAQPKQAMRNLEPPQPTTPSSLPETVNLSTAEIARNLQTELARVGCRPGRVDGNWGRQGTRALARFNKQTGSSLPTGTPSLDAIKKVQSHKRNVCIAAIPTKIDNSKLKAKTKSKSKKKTASVKKSKSSSRGKKCKYERIGPCEARVCAILGNRGECGFINAATYCKKGGKFRRKICR